MGDNPAELVLEEADVKEVLEEIKQLRRQDEIDGAADEAMERERVERESKHLNVALLLINNNNIEEATLPPPQQEHSVIDAPQTVFPMLRSTMEVQEVSQSFTEMVKRGRARAAAAPSYRSALPTMSVGIEVDGPSRKREREWVEVKEEEEEVGVVDAPSPPPPPPPPVPPTVEETVPDPSTATAPSTATNPSQPSKAKKPFTIPKKELPSRIPKPEAAGAVPVGAGNRPPLRQGKQQKPIPTTTTTATTAAGGDIPLSSSTKKSSNFMEGEHIVIKEIGVDVHLADLWIAVVERGGFDMVERRGKWKDVAPDIKVLAKQAPLVRRIYENWLLRPERAMLDSILLLNAQPPPHTVLESLSDSPSKLIVPKLSQGKITGWVPMTDGMLLARMGEDAIYKEVVLKDLKTSVWCKHSIEKYDPINNNWTLKTLDGKQREVTRNLSGLKKGEIRLPQESWGLPQTWGERSLLDGLPLVEVKRRIERVNWGGRGGRPGMMLGPEILKGAVPLEPRLLRTAPAPFVNPGGGGGGDGSGDGGGGGEGGVRPLGVFEDKQ